MWCCSDQIYCTHTFKNIFYQFWRTRMNDTKKCKVKDMLYCIVSICVTLCDFNHPKITSIFRLTFIVVTLLDVLKSVFMLFRYFMSTMYSFEFCRQCQEDFCISQFYFFWHSIESFIYLCMVFSSIYFLFLFLYRYFWSIENVQVYSFLLYVQFYLYLMLIVEIKSKFRYIRNRPEWDLNEVFL